MASFPPLFRMIESSHSRVSAARESGLGKTFLAFACWYECQDRFGVKCGRWSLQSDVEIYAFFNGGFSFGNGLHSKRPIA